MMLAMMLGAYMLPQKAGIGQRTESQESLASCPEQTPREDVLKSRVRSAEAYQDEDVSWVLSFSAEEESGGDELLLSEQGFSLLGHGSERSLWAPPVRSSHVIQLSRRPPRLSIA
jgi:hypothetical protein